MELTEFEARVIGCLLEKEVTTPEQYPLSLNALTLACNQKSSREPVMSLTESQVQTCLDELAKKRLVSEQSGFGSRVVKYKHRFCNTEFSELQLSNAELALICVLLLRGPQTPGELKTRSQRLHEFSHVNEVETCLYKLSQSDKPHVVMLAKEANKRDHRYMELFSQSLVEQYLASEAQRQRTPQAIHSDSAAIAEKNQASDEKICQLETRITLLEQQVAALEAKLLNLLTNTDD
ncbi:YceH family protein [Shewanella sp. SR44-3]|uniref:YceH family protein n=1 Tax=unclassified Shewanella TaxID=196818 RepID=UPI0015FC7062|nr:YceH family protein [Shewanella sp. SR44-3]MBB1270318.1 YceH family protein [Shewanella sp. SR44-3]